MSSIYNWVPEPPLEPVIRLSHELEPIPYHSPPERYTFNEDIRETVRQPVVSRTIRQVLRGYIPRLIATLLGREEVCSIDIYNDNLYGTVLRITTDLPAKEALELWLKLTDYLPYENHKIVLSVKWLGENNVSEDELIEYTVKIMIKSKVGPKALKGFDAARMVREARV
jgi:hypothetical protein